MIELLQDLFFFTGIVGRLESPPPAPGPFEDRSPIHLMSVWLPSARLDSDGLLTQSMIQAVPDVTTYSRRDSLKSPPPGPGDSESLPGPAKHFSGGAAARSRYELDR